jgi:hypothetical protein
MFRRGAAATCRRGRRRDPAVTLRQRLALNTELVDEVCLENEKSLQRMK